MSNHESDKGSNLVNALREFFKSLTDEETRQLVRDEWENIRKDLKGKN